MSRYFAPRGRGLSKRVRWVEHRPIAITVGNLYFEVEMPNGKVQYAYVVNGAPSLRSWWACRILNGTDAVRVTEVFT